MNTPIVIQCPAAIQSWYVSATSAFVSSPSSAPFPMMSAMMKYSNRLDPVIRPASSRMVRRPPQPFASARTAATTSRGSMR